VICHKGSADGLRQLFAQNVTIRYETLRKCLKTYRVVPLKASKQNESPTLSGCVNAIKERSGRFQSDLQN
jgi:hypothetical protein